jgi:hypothetical protein
MIQYVLLIVYLLGGEIKIERTNFKTYEACMESGPARMEAVQELPDYEGGIVAACIEVKETKI